MRRHPRNAASRNSLWMPTMGATTAIMLSSTTKRFGLITHRD
jgi:hypothetical protein